MPRRKLSERERQRFLAPDRLVPVTGLPVDIAAKEVAGRSTNLERARALYDYVFPTMKYEKSGTGRPRRHTLGLRFQRGNCTDFHSLFISMARSQKIPARYCWADFYLKGTGWVPVDISEAWKHPESTTTSSAHMTSIVCSSASDATSPSVRFSKDSRSTTSSFLTWRRTARSSATW